MLITKHPAPPPVTQVFSCAILLPASVPSHLRCLVGEININMFSSSEDVWEGRRQSIKRSKNSNKFSSSLFYSLFAFPLLTAFSFQLAPFLFHLLLILFLIYF